MSNNNLSYPHLLQQAQSAFQQRDFASTCSYCQTLMASFDTQPEVVGLHLQSLIYTQQLTQAEQIVDQYQKALEDAPAFLQAVCLFHQQIGDNTSEYRVWQQRASLAVLSTPDTERYITTAIAGQRFASAKQQIRAALADNRLTQKQANNHTLSLLRAQQVFQEAELFSGELLAAEPGSFYYQNEHAVSLRLSGKPGEALPILEKLTAARQHFAILHNLANCHADMGNAEKAIAYYKKALRLNPFYVDSHINLNKLLWETGDHTTYLTSFSRLIKPEPAFFGFTLAYTHFLISEKLYSKALEQLHTLQPQTRFQHTQHQAALFKALVFDQQFTDAQQLIATQSDPALFMQQHAATAALMYFGLNQLTQAQQLVEQALQENPSDQTLRAYQYCGQRLANVPTNKLKIHTAQLKPTPDGETWATLASELARLHTAIKQQPKGQSVASGTQTRGHLFTLPLNDIGWLKEAVSAAVINACQQFDIDPASICTPTGEVNFIGSWSVSMAGKGFHTNHIHSNGVISGVAYISLPEEVDDTAHKYGWLQFGQPGLAVASHLEPADYVQPRAGLCVLFPSHTWHGTTMLPEGAGQRLTVAFDVGRYGLTET